MSSSFSPENIAKTAVSYFQPELAPFIAGESAVENVANGNPLGAALNVAGGFSGGTDFGGNNTALDPASEAAAGVVTSPYAGASVPPVVGSALDSAGNYLTAPTTSGGFPSGGGVNVNPQVNDLIKGGKEGGEISGAPPTGSFNETIDPAISNFASEGRFGDQLGGNVVTGGTATGPNALSSSTVAPQASSATVSTPDVAGAPASGAESLGTPTPPASYWSAGAENTTGTTVSDAPPASAGTVDAGGASSASSPYSLASQTTPNALPGYSTTPQLNTIGGDVASTTGTGLQAGATQPATGGNWLSKGLNALSSIKPSTALTGAGLALNGYSQYKTNKAMGDMQQQIKNAVQPLTGTQSNLLNQYNSGQLNASDAATINNYVTSQTAQIKQQYAAMGQGGSPQEQQAIAAVQQQAQAMQAQALQNYLTSALQTTDAITGPYATLSQQQIAQDTALQGAAGNVFKAIAAQQSGQPATS